MKLTTKSLVKISLFGVVLMLSGCDGTDGLSAIVKTTSEAAGTNCVDGGMRIDIGLDDSKNGILESSEIDSTQYVCNGVDGTDGADGADGVDGTDGTNGADGTNGLTTLINTSAEPAGMNCANGGIRIDVGLDDDSNGSLEDTEIDSTAYVCNGVDGLTGKDGLTALINTSIESEGENCSNGGTRIDIGLDDDGNGTLETVEIDNTSYVCNGSDGNMTKVLINTLEGMYMECTVNYINPWGTKVDIGLDDNGNNILEPGEIDDTAIICQGNTYIAV